MRDLVQHLRSYPGEPKYLSSLRALQMNLKTSQETDSRSYESESCPYRSQNDAISRFPSLPARKFQIIYADPPWDYKGQLQHAGAGKSDSGGAIRHYATLKTKDLKKLPIGDIVAEDCLLFMWATSPHLDQAIDLGKSWGFAWGTVAFVWNKGRPNPGFYTMSENEICLVFKHGKIPQPRGARNIRQSILHPRQKHSSKPDEARERIEKMFPRQQKVELFARKQVKGWTVWGNEI